MVWMLIRFVFSLFFFLPHKTGGECGCGCVDSSNTVAISSGGPISGPSNSSKTAHTKVATSGGHANTQAPSKRASSGADGDYQLVQHEVLYSLSAEYEVRVVFIISLVIFMLIFCSFFNIEESCWINTKGHKFVKFVKYEFCQTKK